VEPKTGNFDRVATFALMVACGLGLAVALGQTLLFDIALRDAVHSLAWPPLTTAMRIITRLGEPAFLALLGIVVAWGLRGTRRAYAARLALSALGALAVSEALKLVFRRQRPAAFFGYQEPSDYSFPSGHAMVSLCFFGVLAATLAALTKSRARRFGLWAAAAAVVLLIGFSRVYLGVHYPTDVLGGYALGVVWIAAARRITDR